MAHISRRGTPTETVGDLPAVGTKAPGFALASTLENTTVLCVSNDLPMAQNRFCGAEGLSNVATASGFRSDFGDVYGVRILDDGTSHEPDYDAAIAAL